MAEKAQKLSLSGSTLPLRAADNNSYVLTVFWVDNFDVKVERQTGSTSLNTTHMVSFQEKCQKSVFQSNNVTVTRTRKRKLPSVSESIDRQQCYVNPKVEPPMFTNETTSQMEDAEEVYKSTLVEYFLWLWIRKQNNFDQLHPSFSGKLKITSITLNVDYFSRGFFGLLAKINPDQILTGSFLSGEESFQFLLKNLKNPFPRQIHVNFFIDFCEISTLHLSIHNIVSLLSFCSVSIHMNYISSPRLAGASSQV